MTTVKAQVHSTNTQEDVTLIKKREKDYVVKTKEGVYCTAIFNVFTGLYYANDLYGVLKDYKED